MAAIINTRSHMIMEQKPYEMQESHMWTGPGPCPVKWAKSPLLLFHSFSTLLQSTTTVPFCRYQQCITIHLCTYQKAKVVP